MDGKLIIKRIIEENVNGNRTLGKPRKRWVRTMETDSIEILKVRNWKREYLGRQAWRRHLKKVMARLQTVTPYKITLISLSATYGHSPHPP
jgi:hypothetical protein